MRYFKGTRGGPGNLAGALLRAWFHLTALERRAVAIVVFLFTLGAIVRFYRICITN